MVGMQDESSRIGHFRFRELATSHGNVVHSVIFDLVDNAANSSGRSVSSDIDCIPKVNWTERSRGSESFLKIEEYSGVSIGLGTIKAFMIAQGIQGSSKLGVARNSSAKVVGKSEVAHHVLASFGDRPGVKIGKFASIRNEAIMDDTPPQDMNATLSKDESVRIQLEIGLCETTNDFSNKASVIFQRVGVSETPNVINVHAHMVSHISKQIAQGTRCEVANELHTKTNLAKHELTTCKRASKTQLESKALIHQETSEETFDVNGGDDLGRAKFLMDFVNAGHLVFVIRDKNLVQESHVGYNSRLIERIRSISILLSDYQQEVIPAGMRWTRFNHAILLPLIKLSKHCLFVHYRHRIWCTICGFTRDPFQLHYSSRKIAIRCTQINITILLQ